jgi:VanZ family protein
MGRLRVPLLPRWLRWLAVLAVAGVILYWSVQPVPENVKTFVAPFPHYDKVLHGLAYAGLGVTLAYALVRSRLSKRQRALLVLGVAVGYGVGIELLQGRLTARTASVADAGANALGGAIALTWYWLTERVRFVRAEKLLRQAT